MVQYSNKEILAIANTINRQIIATVENQWVYYSWGVSRKLATTYNNMPALALRVSGVYHKGWVYVCYDRGSDTYTVKFINTKNVLKKEFAEVFADMLGELLDIHIERGTGSEDEYAKKASADSQRKMNAEARKYKYNR